MKILIKLLVFRGGAPLSMREYQKVLMTENHEVIVCGEMEPGRERENIFLSDTPCYHIDTCNVNSLISVIKSTLALFRIMKDNKVEMLISASRNDFGVCHAVCRATGSAFLPVIPGGNVSSKARNLISVRNEQFVCFSYENKERLLENGIDKQNVHIISNRIHVEPDYLWQQHYSQRKASEPLKLLLVSRLDREHMAGIFSFMDRVAAYDGQVILNIAGDGKCAAECRAYAEQINKKRNIISLLGYVRNVDSVALQSDVIIGKGRSVITPVMMNRIGVVLGYDGGLSICNEENFDELYRYNFSGRGATNLLDDQKFFELCEKIKNDMAFVESFSHVSELMRNAYSTDTLSEKLMSIIETLPKAKEGAKYGVFQKTKAIWNAIEVYTEWLLNSVYLKLKGE